MICIVAVDGKQGAKLTQMCFWTVIGNVVHVTTAGTVGTWWFVPEEANGCCSQAVRESYVRSLTTSFGSICLGSLIVAIIQALRETVRSIRDNDDSILACVAECILGCIGTCMKTHGGGYQCLTGLSSHNDLLPSPNSREPRGVLQQMGIRLCWFVRPQFYGSRQECHDTIPTERMDGYYCGHDD